MAVVCDRAAEGSCSGEIALYLYRDSRKKIVACDAHAPKVDDTMFVFREVEVLESFAAYLEANKAFTQRYDPALVCCAADSGVCVGGAAEYYFSSGETRPLCAHHVQYARVMMSGGFYISTQYYEEVYDKSKSHFDSVCYEVTKKRHR